MAEYFALDPTSGKIRDTLSTQERAIPLPLNAFISFYPLQKQQRPFGHEKPKRLLPG
jgi:hypothetical protein